MAKNITIKDLRRGDLIAVHLDGHEFLPAFPKPGLKESLFAEGVNYLAVFRGFRYIFDVPGPIEQRMSTCETWAEVPDNADRKQMILKHKGGTREFYIADNQKPVIRKYQKTNDLYRLLYF